MRHEEGRNARRKRSVESEDESREKEKCDKDDV